MQNDLRVGASQKDMPILFQGFAQVRAIIHLTVIDEGDTTIGRLHRLMPGTGQIDDAEPRMPEPHRT